MSSDHRDRDRERERERDRERDHGPGRGRDRARDRRGGRDARDRDRDRDRGRERERERERERDRDRGRNRDKDRDRLERERDWGVPEPGPTTGPGSSRAHPVDADPPGRPAASPANGTNSANHPAETTPAQPSRPPGVAPLNVSTGPESHPLPGPEARSPASPLSARTSAPEPSAADAAAEEKKRLARERLQAWKLKKELESAKAAAGAPATPPVPGPAVASATTVTANPVARPPFTPLKRKAEAEASDIRSKPTQSSMTFKGFKAQPGVSRGWAQGIGTPKPTSLWQEEEELANKKKLALRKFKELLTSPDPTSPLPDPPSSTDPPPTSTEAGVDKLQDPDQAKSDAPAAQATSSSPTSLANITSSLANGNGSIDPTNAPTDDASATTPPQNADPDLDMDTETGPTPEPANDETNSGEVDPLEAFMTDVHSEVAILAEADQLVMAKNRKERAKGQGLDFVEAVDDADKGSDEEDILAAVAKRVKRKDLPPVNHQTMDYEAFRKDFFTEPPELADLTAEEVDLVRADLDGIKIRGARCPKPAIKWSWMGLPPAVFEVIRRVLKYEKPSAIQAQAIPAIMSGRDVIGIAKTGSGKTIAFLLPMFRHIKAQRTLESGEGPIALIMTPTRELATQIHRECKHFVKVLGLRSVCAYGGSPIKDQIGDLKRGAEIIIATPGRIIDLLCANGGRVTNLARVTYLVLDEADRMFDMGFEPQVMKLVNNVRPSRQTVLFSATFPRQMEALARKILTKPLEITVGGRSTVCSDVEQHVEVLAPEAKFPRLLEILGNWAMGSPDGRALIFVDRQDAADNLLRELLPRGYPCQSLHGGKDQVDRDSTIADFKNGTTDILVATSVAARGLDVKQLTLVVNFDCPNHMEDYVHRCGRTGRAGNKGTAYTFLETDQDKFAVDIVKALKLSGTPIPDPVQALADAFIAKIKAGSVAYTSSGFGGKGLDRLDKDRDLVKKVQKRSYGGDLGDEADDEEGGVLDDSLFDDARLKVQDVGAARVPAASGGLDASAADFKFEAIATGIAQRGEAKDATPAEMAALAALKVARAKASALESTLPTSGRDKAAQVLQDFQALHKLERADSSSGGTEEKKALYAYEIVINDFPQKARWRVTNKETINQIVELTGAALTTRGIFLGPGKTLPPGERKLYVVIEGDSQVVVDHAKNEIKRLLTESTLAAADKPEPGKYSVV